ncbi:putative methyltransferase-domain-containing protein [Ganoderma leucocontextum]|nr:putative methyltransferase-domain-containing protein [Ganoderma leucocontextum]
MSNTDTESESDNGMDLGDVFTEPPRPLSPEPKLATYHRECTDRTDWTTINLRLVGSHPLWAHYLWNASLAFASYLDQHEDLYRGRAVLELGAGGALPSLVAAKNGAKRAVITDYPDRALVDNISHNVNQNIADADRDRVIVQGYIWGHPVAPLLEHLPDDQPERAFDLMILSDLIFNHSQHDAMLKTCDFALAKSRPAYVLVFYSHHRPHLAHRDMEFFSKAREQGWTCEEILTRKYPPMFPEDPGEEEVRATVHGWRLTRS